jgi:hypothetical protein
MSVRSQYWNGRGHLQRDYRVQLWPNMAGGRNLHISFGTRRWLIVFSGS